MVSGPGSGVTASVYILFTTTTGTGNIPGILVDWAVSHEWKYSDAHQLCFECQEAQGPSSYSAELYLKHVFLMKKTIWKACVI